MTHFSVLFFFTLFISNAFAQLGIPVDKSRVNRPKIYTCVELYGKFHNTYDEKECAQKHEAWLK
jgi:hypothetical protein